MCRHQNEYSRRILKKVMSRHRFFYVSVAAMLYLYTLYCFDVFLFLGFTPMHAQTSRDSGFFLQNTAPISSGRIVPKVDVQLWNTWEVFLVPLHPGDFWRSRLVHFIYKCKCCIPHRWLISSLEN